MRTEGLDEQLHRSWCANASAWTEAVREGRIASRRSGTDDAVLGAVLATGARRVLDVGCGEGWLARALVAYGVQVTGIDASPELVAAARAAGGGRFEAMRYAALADTASVPGPFDAAVCNFSLLEQELGPLLAGIRSRLSGPRILIVQTVHPWAACGDGPYSDGWRTEDFAAFEGNFPEPMPWYFRTLGSWLEAIAAGGFTVESCAEPLDPKSERPLSLLIRARAVG